MAVIRVNLDMLSAACRATDTFAVQLEEELRRADETVDALEACWDGADSRQFYAVWKRNFEQDAAFGGMLKELRDYGARLHFAEEKYRTAQDAALNRAARL